MIAYLEVEGVLKACRLTDSQHIQVLSDISALGAGLHNHEAIILLASTRRGVARMIAETGKFIILEKA